MIVYFTHNDLNANEREFSCKSLLFPFEPFISLQDLMENYASWDNAQFPYAHYVATTYIANIMDHYVGKCYVFKMGRWNMQLEFQETQPRMDVLHAIPSIHLVETSLSPTIISSVFKQLMQILKKLDQLHGVAQRMFETSQ